MESVPPGFHHLQDAFQNSSKPCNVIGVVTDFQPPAPTKGTDWQVTFSIQSNDVGTFGGGYRVKFFVKPDQIPPVKGARDVVVLRNIKSKDYLGSILFLSNHDTECTVFPAQAMPEKFEGNTRLEYHQNPKAQGARFAPDHQLMRYAWQLWDFWKSYIPDAVPAISTSEEALLGKQGFKLLEKVSHGGFYELLGQVVKIYDQNGSGVLTIYLTDYTSNLLFYNYRPIGQAEERDGDEFGYITRNEAPWEGPPGQFTLAIDLWDSHASWCRNNLKKNDYVRLGNVQVTFGKDAGSKLEGKMRGDRKWPDKVNIRKVSHSEYATEQDQDLKELLLRKRDFVKQFGDWQRGEGYKGKKKMRSKPEHAAVTKMHKNEDDGRGQPVQQAEQRTRGGFEQQPEPERPSKNQKKRLRKERRAAQAAGAAASEGDDKGNPDIVNDDLAKRQERNKRREPDESNDAIIPKARGQLRAEYDSMNTNIATTHRSEALLTLSEILEYPINNQYSTSSHRKITLDYDNRAYATEVRVVDFHPSDLRDFAARESVTEFDHLDDDDDDDEEAHQDMSQAQNEDFSDESSDDDKPASTLPPDTPTDSNQRTQKGYRWTWRFALLLQDRKSTAQGAPQQLVAYVAGDNASYLLKGLEACNLHKVKNEDTLSQLREKLFILWGNLQERKEEALDVDVDTQAGLPTESSVNVARMGASTLAARRPWKTGLTNRPFRCCLREYGIRERSSTWEAKDEKIPPVYTWVRRFQIFDTVIKS